MKEIVSIDPFRCRMWEYHDRIEQHIDEISCKAEIESFRKHGQLVPALGRRLRDIPDYEIELIYGARRRFVAMHLNLKLQVELRDITDSEAVIAMDIENRHRLDISPYERGVSYLTWIRAGLFGSQEEIARKLGVSASQVSRHISLAQLPTVIVEAFKRPSDICETWGHDLIKALEDPERRSVTCRRARAIASTADRPEPRAVLRELLSASNAGKRVRKPAHDEVVHDESGAPLFRIRHLSKAVALLIPMERLVCDRLSVVRDVVATSLSGAATPE